MNAWRELISGPVAEAVGWALLHSLWQGALIALVLYTVLRQMSGRSSEARYTFSVCALGVILLLPFATAWEIFHEAETPVRTVMASSSRAVSTSELQAVASSGVIDTPSTSGDVLVSMRGFASANLPLVVLLWTAGVSLFSFRLLAGWLRLRAMVHDSVQAPAHLREMMNSLADRLEIWQPLRMLESRLVDVPTVIGWFEPVILMPVSALTGLSREQLETILAHELAHVRRHDYAVNLAQTVVETLFFYHPATWWISRQIRIERENCCDDLAVAVCGDAVMYARALATLEQLRSVPGPAIAASGGSLLFRVRRLLSAPESRCSTKWVAGVSVLTLAAAILIAAPLTMFAFGREPVPVPEGTSITVTAGVAAPLVVEPTADFERAAFAVEPDCDREYETFLAEYRSARNDSHVVEVSDLTELFRLEDLSNGSVRLAMFGIDSGSESDGDERAVEDVRTITNDELLKLRHVGVSSAYIEALRSAGLDALTADEVVTLFVNGVSADYAMKMSSAGVPLDEAGELLTLRLHGIRPELVDQLHDLGYDDLDVEQIASTAIHGVTASWLKSMHDAGFAGDDFDQLIAMRNQGVNPALISEIRKLDLDDQSSDAILSMVTHGVTPEFVRDLAKNGYSGASVNDLLSFRIHGVSPAFIGEMRSAGYAGIDGEDLVALRIHGVTPAFVRELRSAGLDDLELDEMVAARIHGVSPAFITEIRSAGYPDIDLEELVALRIHGIDAAWIRELRAAGQKDLDIDELISIRIREREGHSRTGH